MPRRTDRPPHTVAVLAYDGLCTFEFAIAVEIFGLPRPELGPDWYRFAVHPIQSGPLRATGGIRICAPQRNALARADTIVIPGWCDPETDPPPALLSALRRAHARGARLLSICSGVFVLAATGLLDGRRATTHWLHAERLRARYPRIEVDPGVIYVDEGQLLTSAGSSAGIDLCLHLVRRDYGPAVANQIARRLVVPAHREGGQAQYVEQPVPRRERAGVGPLLDRIRAGLDQPWPVPRMAEQMHMSERNFLRRFREATGRPPGEWLLGERLARARELLETTTHPVDAIAERCGFGTAAALRHHFARRIGLSPQRYRERFSQRAE
ncbi:transcriptional regulator FtrA [Rehaibacterium terrae]|jgi:AraC family transcriptional activator FtrA|uniref:AraC family transcriptional activator FtrA n=1 Tax=Rehaibacterium terrae TaxID=1341696 RepID=A0A7W7XXY3_9GAMM|nr:transcriptional regulator FtrA [Rehaibacterium terrae]MBB5014736.1 AraC family transcriptional activator FtrA [Rehaibacterium terrae]